jgi:hypothetical protein
MYGQRNGMFIRIQRWGGVRWCGWVRRAKSLTAQNCFTILQYDVTNKFMSERRRDIECLLYIGVLARAHGSSFASVKQYKTKKLIKTSSRYCIEIFKTLNQEIALYRALTAMIKNMGLSEHLTRSRVRAFDHPGGNCSTNDGPNNTPMISEGRCSCNVMFL